MKTSLTMYKCLKDAAVSVAIALILTAAAEGQSQSFDIIRFTPPKSWTITNKDGAVVVSNVESAKNAFCVVTISSSRPSEGTPQSDFTKEWASQIVVPYKAEAKPKSDSQIDDGWTTTSAAAPIEIDGIKSLALLTVISGYGRVATILSILNSDSYLVKLDELMASIVMDKSKILAATTSSPARSSVPIPGAPAGKFGHLLYKPMNGWKETLFTNAVSFTPEIVPNGYGIEVRIMESKPFNGPMAQAFADSWSDRLQQLGSTATAPPTVLSQNTSRQGWEYARGEGIVTDKSGNLFYLNQFVIKLNGRIERMFAVSQKIKGQFGTVRSLNQFSYATDYDNMFYSVKFDDWVDKGSAGTFSGGGLAGMYVGLKLGNGDVADGGGLGGSYAVLFSNGQVYFTTKLPTIGFDGLNTQADADSHVRNWGTYFAQNGKGQFTMPYGAVPLVAGSGGLTLTTQNTPHQYVRLPSVDGAVFSGNYSFADSRDGKAAPSISFTSDGKFVDRGAVNILYHNTTEAELNLAARPGSGTYHVRNYSLILDYSDGRRLQIAFSGAGFDKGNPSPAKLTLSFNNDELFKR